MGRRSRAQKAAANARQDAIDNVPGAAPAESSVAATSAIAPTPSTYATAGRAQLPPANNAATPAAQLPMPNFGSLSVSGQNSGLAAIPSATAASSATTGSSNASSQQAAPADDKINQNQKSTFFDQQYELSPGRATEGIPLKVRVNRFDIDLGALPDRYYVYHVTLPRLNGRVVTRRHIKKMLMRKVLAQQQPWTQAFNNNLVYTDWDNTIITTKPLANLVTGNLPIDAQGVIHATIDFVNQSAPPGTASQTLQVDVKEQLSIYKGFLTQYLNTGPPFFNYNEHVKLCNNLVKHFAAQPANTNAICIGSNKIFSTHQNAERALPSGLIARRGFHASVRPVNSALQLQLNTTTAAFYPQGSLISFLRNYLGNNRFHGNVDKTSGVWPEVWALIRQLKVRYRYIPPNAWTAAQHASPQSRPRLLQNPHAGPNFGRLKTITDAGLPAAQVNITITTGAQRSCRSVLQHFNHHVLHPVDQLQYPNLPLINVGPIPSATSNDQPVWVPMELLSIEQLQSVRGTVPDRDMRVMGPFARDIPLNNVANIEQQGMALLQAGALQQHSVITFARAMKLVDARRLDLPRLWYKNDESVPKAKLSNGKWNLENSKLTIGTSLSKLLVVQVGNPSMDNAAINRNIHGDYGLRAGLDYYGVSCSIADVKHSPTTTQADLDQALNAFNGGNGPEGVKVILVILSKHDANDYAAVKTWGEIHRGINTVCVITKNANRLSAYDFQANLALKFNAKLGGTNHQLAMKLHRSGVNKKTMVVGADVSHPGTSSVSHCPSVAAVVASCDRFAMHYPGSVRLQAGRTENIVDMKEMMMERLQHFKKIQKTLPSDILFYRDGVSEGQFGMVKAKELAAVNAACQAVEPGYLPNITMVICTKRHQTRFYPRDEKEKNLCRNTRNFLPGLVVDDPSVRLPHYFDFFLQGHKAIQGTARPCHYFVLQNGMRFTPDELQELTFALHWVYATALTPISLAAPTYYADKLCERGRAYIRPLVISQHQNRPTQASIDVVVTATHAAAPSGEATDEQVKTAVARHFSTHPVFWPHANHPCHPAIRDTMFYV